jgi:hypothetical protein
MAVILCLILIFITSLAHALSIVFVHIGQMLPPHLFVTISQARLFNKNCSIYLIAEEKAILHAARELENDQVIGVACESLQPSEAHVRFRHIPGHNRGYYNLWIYTSERFFYLEEFINQYNLTDVFHLENDILVYRNLEELLPVFQKYYNGMIGATFTNVNRACAGIMYISHSLPLQAFVQCFSEPVNDYHTDMHILSQFGHQHHKVWVDSLPILMPEYVIEHPLNPKLGGEIAFFSNHIDQFGSIFDGSALGIYTAGWDSRYHPHWAAQPGQVEVHSIFNSSHFIYGWELDGEGRRIPFLMYEGKKWPINNLHLTNKSRIAEFHSLYRNS